VGTLEKSRCAHILQRNSDDDRMMHDAFICLLRLGGHCVFLPEQESTKRTRKELLRWKSRVRRHEWILKSGGRCTNDTTHVERQRDSSSTLRRRLQSHQVISTLYIIEGTVVLCWTYHYTRRTAGRISRMTEMCEVKRQCVCAGRCCDLISSGAISYVCAPQIANPPVLFRPYHFRIITVFYVPLACCVT